MAKKSAFIQKHTARCEGARKKRQQQCRICIVKHWNCGVKERDKSKDESLHSAHIAHSAPCVGLCDS